MHTRGFNGLAKDLRRRVAAVIAEEEYDHVLVGQVVFEPNLPLVGLKARLVYSKLSNLGNVRYLDPPLADIENRETLDTLCFGIVTERPPEAVQHYLQVAGVQQIIVEPFERRRSPETAVAPGRANSSELGAKPAETLRVDVERLDRLMNLAGQLAIGKARVAQIGEKLKHVVTGEKAVQIVNNLFETIHLLDSVSDGIRQNVMDMRMLPIGPLFTRFHRVIRDITHANGKDIRLAISGEKTELDKRMIDELGDPMIHLIRNAADHGIEVAGGARGRGKAPARHDFAGRLPSRQQHRHPRGRRRPGPRADRIRAKAVEKGLVAAADAEPMTRQQICQLIWLPGLSTAEKVTDVSGRGMGMDIVRAKIKDLNGAVEVAERAGAGHDLHHPAALDAGRPAQLDGGKRRRRIRPADGIGGGDRSRRPARDGHGARALDRSAARPGGRRFRDSARSSTGAASIRPHANEPDKTMLVIIGEGNRQLGLAVDRVLGEEDVVIKSIGDNYRNVAGIAGASILGDGRVSLNSSILPP